MNILVTGGAGFIGSNLVKFLSESGSHQVTIVDNLSSGHQPLSLPSVTFVKADFADRTIMLPLLKRTDIVVHLAALSGVIDSVNDPGPNFKVNVEGSFQLLCMAKESGVRRFVNASTGGAILGNVVPPISESMAPSPLSPYGASKLAVEGYCSAFTGSYGLPCITLRFSNIYGPFSAHKKSVVASFIKNFLRKEPMVIYGDGTQQRDYLYVGDLVRGIETAIRTEVVGVYQLGSGKPTTLIELIEVLKKEVSKDLSVHFEGARRGEVHKTWCNISKASQQLGFSPSTSLKKGIRETLSWFIANKEFALRSSILTSSD